MAGRAAVDPNILPNPFENAPESQDAQQASEEETKDDLLISIHDLEAERTELDQTNRKKRRLLKQLSDNITSSQVIRNQAQNAKILQLEDENEALQQRPTQHEMDGAVASAIQPLQSRITSQERLAARLQARPTQGTFDEAVRSAQQPLQQELDTMRNEMANSEQRPTHQALSDAVVAAAQPIEKRRQIYKDRVRELETRPTMLQRNYKDLQTTAEELKKANQHLRTSADDLQESQATLQEDKNQVQEAQREIYTAKGRLEEDLQTAPGELRTLQNRFNTISIALQEKNSELGTQRTKCFRLEKNSHLLKSNIKSPNQLIKSQQEVVRKAHEVNKTEKSGIQQQLQEATSRVQNL
ncbi:uncharacterized protein K460DRAFT_402325 [Cucurbitaria berberidis CBS 394.84]|uniref:Uncharacterized protein n=1 Tax=Cucurbitaria berberidis CBS 394.84 TaxID=1168544 RepID=A0A9P4GJZ8_9PLEO|nr:uncharacterized protein K460DRAFT_402325 [Cucurbitaria berberidis CBS 394.84]KAF1846960.1 hypothetical protein K460DRAFT_402325 [Cucurbitaria berberidis CBS 394.84]